MFGFLPGSRLCCQKAAQTYRAHFCGLGSSLHRHYGPWARWLVNRDSTFITLLGSAITTEAPPLCLTTCCMPLAAPRDLLADNSVLRYAGAVTLCGLSAKMDDDRQDERGWRKGLANIGTMAFDQPIADALGLLHAWRFPVMQVRRWMADQSSHEYAGTSLSLSASNTSASYGEIMGHLSVVCAVPEIRPILKQIGESLGLLIYTQDAWDDWQQDRHQGKFNPLQNYTAITDRRSVVLPQMQQAFGQIRSAFEALPLCRNRDLLHSILILGVQQRIHEVSGEKPTKAEKKEASSWCSRCDCYDCSNCGDCCGCFRNCRLSKSSTICDCNPCDGDGIECCGCDCS